MSQTYLFFQPTRLPLGTHELESATVVPLRDDPSLRRALEQLLPGLTWQSEHLASANVGDNWLEIRIPQASDSTLGIRCSLRADHSAFVQGICDQLGWLAFDERPYCYQPGRAPVPA